MSRPKPRAKLADIAARAGVSVTTASFVMSGRTDMRISTGTTERVLRAARELDYRPNLTARSLRTQDSRTIGLVADSIATGHHGGTMIQGSLHAAVRHGRRMLVVETAGEPEVEDALIADLVSWQVEGFVYATESHDEARVPPALREQPIVLLNCRDGAIPAVVPDEVAGGRTAALPLTEAGHRARIYVVGEAPDDVVPGRDRVRGITAALQEAGTTLDGHVECAWSPEAAYDALTALLAAGAQPAALICLNDRIALGVYQALAEADVGVPNDVSVVSFDDSDLARWLRPGITSVALPHFEMGALAVETLLDEDRRPGVQLVPMPLRERGSVAPPSRTRPAR
jgi:LacI family transcriptional regulator